MDNINKKAFLAKTILMYGNNKTRFLIQASIEEAFKILPKESNRNTVLMKATKIFKNIITSFTIKQLKIKYKELLTNNISITKNTSKKDLIDCIINYYRKVINSQLYYDIRIKENIVKLNRKYFN